MMFNDNVLCCKESSFRSALSVFLELLSRGGLYKLWLTLKEKTSPKANSFPYEMIPSEKA